MVYCLMRWQALPDDLMALEGLLDTTLGTEHPQLPTKASNDSIPRATLVPEALWQQIECLRATTAEPRQDHVCQCHGLCMHSMSHSMIMYDTVIYKARTAMAR